MTRQRIEVVLFAPGTFETPELSISIRRPDGAVYLVVPSHGYDSPLGQF